MGGQNLNFASPIDAARSLLSSVNALAPLAGADQGETVTGSAVPASDRIWTSMRSGRDYKVRIEGDYIYTEWVNLPASLSSTAAFVRSELKKAGDRWVGKSRAWIPYNYSGQRRWCSVEGGIEITSVTQSRIEGRAEAHAGFDAKKCEPQGLYWESFTWIPKDQ